jgi:hypothetical protein
MIEVCMKNKDINEEYNYINSIRKNLQVIGNILLGNNGCLRNQLNSGLKSQLINAIDSLEKEMDPLPDSYKHEINLIITAARFKLSYIENE